MRWRSASRRTWKRCKRFEQRASGGREPPVLLLLFLHDLLFDQFELIQRVKPRFDRRAGFLPWAFLFDALLEVRLFTRALLRADGLVQAGIGDLQSLL